MGKGSKILRIGFVLNLKGGKKFEIRVDLF